MGSEYQGNSRDKSRKLSLGAPHARRSKALKYRLFPNQNGPIRLTFDIGAVCLAVEGCFEVVFVSLTPRVGELFALTRPDIVPIARTVRPTGPDYKMFRANSL